jgi:NADH:ubiquinone oxidoreductase subunit 3 (subunit A)
MTKDLILNPAVAFLIYLALVGMLYGLGRRLAAPGQTTAVKSSTYASGELPPMAMAGPGYRPFFVVALFFAVLHLGSLVLASGTMNATTLVYLIGIMIALVALILG